MIPTGSVPRKDQQGGELDQPDVLKLNMSEVAAHRQMGELAP